MFVSSGEDLTLVGSLIRVLSLHGGVRGFDGGCRYVGEIAALTVTRVGETSRSALIVVLLWYIKSTLWFHLSETYLDLLFVLFWN